LPWTRRPAAAQPRAEPAAAPSSASPAHPYQAQALREAVDRISFRFAQPSTWCKDGYVDWNGERVPLDVVNTDFGDRTADVRGLFAPILDTPRMSTIAIGYIINTLVGQIAPGASYVNVGTWHGFSFFAGLLGNRCPCVGIDNFSQFGDDTGEHFRRRLEALRTPATSFHELDYREYFASVHAGEIGVYFYDGHHDYEHQLEGLTVAEPFFTNGTFVVVDDTNWPEPRQATMDFVAQRRQLYNVLLDVTTAVNGHPTYWNGLIVLQRNAVGP
jgi:hypothetical protein